MTKVVDWKLVALTALMVVAAIVLVVAPSVPSEAKAAAVALLVALARETAPSLGPPKKEEP